VAEKTGDKARRGPLRVIADWWSGGRASLRGGPDPDATPARGGSRAIQARVPSRIGHYTIEGVLGRGGMGVVYAARDERLQRPIALKTMSSLSGDETARKRFWREARAAASVNHPNVCQLYEIGEEAGELFIAMELLEGEPLSGLLRRGSLIVSETLPIALQMLDALEALHSRGIVHRDLKPSNVFLTSRGVKLLDFGLAVTQDGEGTPAQGAATQLTQAGMVMGTPRYMAPEQVTGESVDARGDLFAAGAILFEMLAGRPAFEGRNAVEILHATLHEQPPALTGSPAVAAVDRVIRRALAKRPADRPPSAAAMADALRGASGLEGDDTPVAARALTRLVVMPFRALRSDPETDFLTFSLPDAIATSLTGVGSLVVRSTTAAARFAGAAPDLKAVAAEVDVDRVVMGTLLRSGDQLRATAQLVEAPGGTLLASLTTQSSLGDLFRLQDEVARRVVDALALPLMGTPPLTPDAPHDARAYELFLRANELGRAFDQLPAARDLYQRCVELDPGFAPAWAQLGRCHWMIGKYIGGAADSAARAEEAFARALELNPRLALAHRLYALYESDIGQPDRALVRLLREAAQHGNDAELFAGLVTALRYGGLYQQSLLAHDEARRLDPKARTSVEQTLLMAGDLDRLLAVEDSRGGLSVNVIQAIGLGLAGRREESRRILVEARQASRLPSFRAWGDTLVAWIDRRPADMLASLATLGAQGIVEDPEHVFQQGWLLCEVGEHQRALEYLRRAVARGFYAAPTLESRPEFAALRNEPAFNEVLAQAQAGRRRALDSFRDSGGERLLGLWQARLGRLDDLLEELRREEEAGGLG
jgi:non-specific serine/threonine protein kinase